MGTQKNRLNETVLLSTQNICYNRWVRKYLQFYTENFCLSKPINVISINMFLRNELIPSKHTQQLAGESSNAQNEIT